VQLATTVTTRNYSAWHCSVCTTSVHSSCQWTG